MRERADAIRRSGGKGSERTAQSQMHLSNVLMPFVCCSESLALFACSHRARSVEHPSAFARSHLKNLPGQRQRKWKNDYLIMGCSAFQCEGNRSC
jgi:hypothetical protein